MMCHKCFTTWLSTIATIAIFLHVDCCYPATPESPSVVITNVTVFDSAREQMLAPQSVLIKGDRIQAVGPSLVLPAGAQIIEGNVKFLIPGLIDAHVHLVHLSDRTHVMGEEFLPMFLGAGVTSVRSTGDAVAVEKSLVQYTDQHPEICPRIFMASPLIDGDPPFHKDVGLAVTRADQVPKLVEEMQQAGVTTLKMYVGTSRGIGQLVIAEGHRRGPFVTPHLGRYAAHGPLAPGTRFLGPIWGGIYFIVPRGRTSAKV